MTKTSPSTKFRSSARSACAGVVVLLAPLAGCTSGTDRVITSSIPPHDYQTRHPIVVAERPRTLDVFVANHSGSLDRRTLDQVRQFAADTKATQVAPITILLPQGSGHDLAARATLPTIEQALSEGGAQGYVNVGSYPVSEPGMAAPVRLIATVVGAKVASRCGQWPRDLASGSTVDGWDNEAYWNFGCAYQSNIASQVADGRDLVGPRAADPSDVQMRMRAIGDVRKGADPGTNWTIKNSNLGAAGG
jgi:pilus assembly protein CpaD